MDPQTVTDNREVGDLSAARNSSVSDRIKAFNGLAKESNRSKRENYGDILPQRISELMKLGDLENAPSQAIFGVVNRFLDESIEKTNEDIPLQVASVLKLLVQEIEQRVSQQADNIQKQSNLYKSREDRFHSKIKALETLTTETNEANEVINKQLQQIKRENEEERKLEKQDLIKLRKEKESCENKILSLNEELNLAKQSYGENLLKLEIKAEEAKDELRKKILELECLLTDSRKKIKDLEDFSESKQLETKRGQEYGHIIDSQLGSIQELRSAAEYVKQEILRIKNIYAEEFNHLGLNLKHLMDAAQNYHTVLEENRKLYNEVQDLKGNIRVYCRIRPFLLGKSGKQTTIRYISENGELAVIKPSKSGKDNPHVFKFDKVFGPAATQEEVFRDIRPLIRSVLDGYNVCLFAYGQTGSGKTYTMTGPNATSFVDWGVNYRALNDLFNISQKRCCLTAYEIGVQMIEIYNEQVHDLLSSVSFQKRLGIWNTSQPNGLDVSDTSLHPVNSISDILELMNIGFMTREGSSRSHRILTVHIRGSDLKTKAISRSCLHLVDLAGSERVNQSEATDHRCQGAHHVNKSISALGDVISSLARKSPQVPYRNSKLTQVLQSSLGSQTKILMLLQLNPEVESHSETINTLKFAERISGVELGATPCNEGHGVVTELMEQVASLKGALAKKDEEIRSLQVPKITVNNERNCISTPNYEARHSNGATMRSQKLLGGKSLHEKAASSIENNSDYTDMHSDTGSQQSFDDFKHHREFFLQSRLAVVGGPEKFSELKFSSTDSKNLDDDIELWGLGDPDNEERLSDISDGDLSMGTETDGSINSIIEYILFPETTKPAEEITEKTSTALQLFESTMGKGQSRAPLSLLSKSSSKTSGSKKAAANSSAFKAPKRWQ